MKFVTFARFYATVSHQNAFIIETLEGAMDVSINDYIIKGVNDEFYPCKPDIFEKTYVLNGNPANQEKR